MARRRAVSAHVSSRSRCRGDEGARRTALRCGNREFYQGPKPIPRTTPPISISGLHKVLLNRDPEAIASYKKVLELKPDLYEAQLNLGIVLLRSKQPAEAAQYLEAAAKQKPKEFRPAYNAALALLESGAADPSDSVPSDSG